MTLPNGWRRTTLGDLGRYLNGRAFKRAEWRDTGRPIIRIQNLTGSSKTFNYFKGEVDDRNVVRNGDLLVSWSATLGAYIWDGPEAVLNQHIFKVESSIDREFHRYLLEHKLNELKRHTHGSGMVHITRRAFDSVPVDVPDLPEQRRIVELLEEHLSRLDAADSYLSAGLTRGHSWHAKVTDQLVWSPGYPAAPVRSLLREPMRNGRSDRAVQGGEGGTRTLTLTAVTRNTFTEEHTKLTTTTRDRAKNLWLEPGDILVQRSNTPELVGTSARFEGPRDWAIFPDLLIRLRANESLVDSRFLSAVLRSGRAHTQLRRRAKGAAGSMPKIDQETIGSVAVPLPPLEEQRQIVAHLSVAETGLRRIRGDLEVAQRRSTALRRSLLVAAFAGLLSETPAEMAIA